MEDDLVRSDNKNKMRKYSIRRSNLWIMGKKTYLQSMGTEYIFNKLISDNFPNLWKEMNIPVIKDIRTQIVNLKRL